MRPPAAASRRRQAEDRPRPGEEAIIEREAHSEPATQTADGATREPLWIVVRPAAEVSIKARATRAAFLRRLKVNLKDALKRAEVQARVLTRYTRTMVRIDPGDEDPAAVQERAFDALTRVFGVGSFSPVEGVAPARIDAIVAMGTELFADRVVGRRYAVRCKRKGSHAFGSTDVERALGAALNPGATVDLTDPEVTVSVEITGGRALLFCERLPGPGGLPIGTGGRAVALLSGGFDSAVAAWYVMKRGIEMDFVFCSMGGVTSERLALQVAKVLTDRWTAGSRPDFLSLEFDPVVDDLRGSARSSYWQVVLKRQMLRAADAAADGIEARLAHEAEVRRQRRPPSTVDAIVTGEAIGQVSSQTLSNLRAIDGVASRPVLRPLIGLDKLEIMAVAERIGTAALSAQVRETCAITPDHPVTHSSAERVAGEEEGLDRELLARTVAEAKRLPVRALKPADLMLPYLFVEAVPEGATLVDCRTAGARRARPLADARPADAASLVRRRGELDKACTYVLVCEVGTRSAQAAEVLQQSGFDAYSFRGGERALRRWLERSRVGP